MKKMVTRFAATWGLVALLASPLASPFVGSASAAWEVPSDEDPTHFWDGEGDDPNDQTTDPDEPFDGLDRIVSPEKPVVSARTQSFLERLVRFMQSLRFFAR